MAALLTDDLWEAIAPLLPKHTPAPKGGAPRKPDRACLAGILFVRKTGCAWQAIPTELGASGSTCWRRLQEWHQAGVWPKAHEVLLGHLGRAGQIDLSRAVLDSASVRALTGGRTPARTRPTEAREARSAM
jgi:transposase